MDIYTIREKVLAGMFRLSDHADAEVKREGYSVADLTTAILSGEIVDEHSEDPRGTEYLVRGRTWTKEYLQLDVGIDDDGYVVIVTVYPRQRKRGRKG